jgi:hypothetical protein
VDKLLPNSLVPFLSPAGDYVLDNEIGYEVLDWNYLPQNTHLWRAFVNTNTNTSNQSNSENFLTPEQLLPSQGLQVIFLFGT